MIVADVDVWLSFDRVTDEGLDKIYILSASATSPTGTILKTLDTPRGSRPMGICFSPDGTAVYVTYMATGQLAKWNPSTRQQIATLDVGPTPRPIAIMGDSSRIFVGRYISATLPFNVASEVGEVREINAILFTVTRTFTLAHDQTVDTEVSGRGTPNYLFQMAITPDGKRLFVPSKKDNVDRGLALGRDGRRLGDQNIVRSIVSQLDLVGNMEDLDSRIDIDNHGLSHGVAFSPLGDLAFVAFQGNNDIKVINVSTGATVVTLSVGTSQLAPQDLVFNNDGSRLFVMNFMTRTVSVLDTSRLVNGTVGSTSVLDPISTVTTEKLSAQVLLGKQVFYNSADKRMSENTYLSCASCHQDGESDQRVWDFTDQGEGLRNTHSLRGHGGMAHGNLHSTANFDEIQDFENPIRNFFGGTGFMTDPLKPVQSPLGEKNANRSPELDALAAYVSTLSTFGKSPNKDSTGQLSSDAIAGRAIFKQLNCVSCHGGNSFSDSVVSQTTPKLHNVGTYKSGTSGNRLGAILTGFDAPTLRGLWATAPYLHDGSAATLLDVITTQNMNDLHGVTSTLTVTQKAQLVAYLRQVDDYESLRTNSSLGGLGLSMGTLPPPFGSNTLVYTATVSNATSQITVLPTVADNAATVTVNGVTMAAGSTGIVIGLYVGNNNTITTVVTADDGSTTQTYTVVVRRLDTNLGTWRATNFPGSTSTSGVGADTASPRGDGVSNLLKFATGLDPSQASPMPGTITQVHDMLSFTYTPSAAAVADGFSFVVEYSDTLAAGSWQTDLVTQGTIGVGGSAVTATVPMSTGLRRFLRLKVSAPLQ